jgi:polysaccharide export outer membrane protein
MKVRRSKIFLFACFICLTQLLGASLPAQSPPPPYQVGPNDILHIYVWKEPELTRDVTVMSDGRITFPLIGQVMAQGKSLEELKTILTEKLKQYVTAPEITVILVDSRSRFIYLIGKVGKPGPLPLPSEMTVIQALAAAGGFAQWADTKNIIIVRREEGKEIQIPFNYNAFVDGKAQNIILKPNDTIVIP